MCFFSIIFLCISFIFCFMSVVPMYSDAYNNSQHLPLICTLFHFKVPFLVFFNTFGLNSTLSDNKIATSFFDQDFSYIHLFKIIYNPLSNNLDSFKYMLSIYNVLDPRVKDEQKGQNLCLHGAYIMVGRWTVNQ